MIEIDGKWIMEGLDYDDDRRIKDSRELTEYINKVGFLPLFKNNVVGFSVEEMTSKSSWWSGNSQEDPWAWREVIASEGNIAYGKLFNNKAGFVSKEWYPVFAAYRRNGYDFESRYEDGLASYKAKKVMDILNEYEELPSYELKKLAGFGKEGEKGFEGAITNLQMQTYITVKGFHKKKNKKNEEYGWSVATYTLPEHLFGEEHVKSAYSTVTKEAKEKIISHLLKIFSQASYETIDKCLR